MKSTRARGRIAAAAVMIALAGGLAACGGNESTVSSTPSAVTPTAAPGAGAAGGGAAATGTARVDPSPTGKAETAPPETPEALPTDYPGPTKTEITQQDQKFLDALRSEKIAFADASDAAVSTGNYVCAAQASDTPADQIHATVLATIALDAQARGAQVDAEAATTTFIATAQSTLCA